MERVKSLISEAQSLQIQSQRMIEFHHAGANLERTMHPEPHDPLFFERLEKEDQQQDEPLPF